MTLSAIAKQKYSHSIITTIEYQDTIGDYTKKRDTFSLILLCTGQIVAEIDNVSCYIKAPSLLCLNEIRKFKIVSECNSSLKVITFDPVLINPNLRVDTIRNDQSHDYSCMYDYFKLLPFMDDDVQKVCLKLGQSVFKTVLTYFNLLNYNLTQRSDFRWAFKVRTYFMDIVTLTEKIYHNYYNEKIPKSDCNANISKEFADIIAFINNNIGSALTVGFVCKRFGINKNTIQSMFKEYAHTTFNLYVQKTRYELACHYLRFTNMDGNQISQKIGFSSSQNFCKFFKKTSGMSPNSFRKNSIKA
ncbi:MAG: hypothetical protein K0R90_1623 [Oscillospiraceae bacterium]|jgi:AraC-like DNA-binding protein|nr:hypothetical protein [Oscillospiraceae bacterium]